ncbi:MAG: hypothetical protein PHS41_06010 [Victivallaceae bacterium]|nr:hypothetical protein [Victivallaceae bacterium]
MENNEKNTNSKNNDDLRTLLIALLTTIVVLAFYHIGVNLCKMYNCRPEPRAICQEYVLIPVSALPQGGRPGIRSCNFRPDAAPRGESFRHEGRNPAGNDARPAFNHPGKAPRGKDIPPCPGAICEKNAMTPDGMPVPPALPPAQKK